VRLKILLAEDDPRLGELIAHMLKKKAGYTVEWTTSGEDAYDLASVSAYDVLVLDWMLPERDGREVCRQLRRDGYKGAILMLTARDSLEDRIRGLDAGADDYLVKPFEIDELLARLRALGRRTFLPLEQETCRIGEQVVLQRDSHRMLAGEQEVQLTPREYQLLDLLLKNQGTVLTREVMLDRIWGMESEVTLKTIDATVKLLRKKLALLDGEQQYIHSIRGVGYTFEG